MANPWDEDELVAPAQASANPWDEDEVVGGPITDLPQVNALPPDFSGVTATVDSTADGRQADGWKAGPLRDAAFGGRSVIQGAGNLLGAIGGDAFNSYVVNPIARALGAQEARPYAQEANALANALNLPQAQTAGDRVLGDIGEGLTGTALSLGTAGLARGAANPIVSAVGNKASQGAGVQVASTALGSGAAGTTRELGGGPGAQLAAGLTGGLAPTAIRVGAPALASGILSGTVPEARRELAREAQARGVDLTPAQLSDSRFVKYVQSALRSVPFTGAAKRSEQQVNQFNRAVAQSIGETADTVDSQVYARAKQRQSDLFDELTSRNAIKVDDKLLKSLENVSNNANANREAKAKIDDAIEFLYSQSTTGPNGVVIPGTVYQALDSELGQIAKAGGQGGHHVGQLRDAIRAGMDRSIAPQDAQAWRQLRTEYGNRKTIAPLVARSGDEGISPQGVLGAATNSQSAKEAVASGTRGEMATLGNIGRRMREPPSSGTAERAAVTSLFTLGGYANPAIGALSYTAAQLASRGLDSRTIARLMIAENPGLSMADAERIAAQAVIPATSSATQATE